MEAKKTAGRQKIPLQKIDNNSDRYATFSKRRSSIFKNASELVRYYDDVDIGIIVFTPAGLSHSFIYPTTNVIIDRTVLNLPATELDATEQLVAANVRNKVKKKIDKLDELDRREEAANEEGRFLDRMNETRVKGWWENIDQFSEDDVAKFATIFAYGNPMLEYRVKKLENGASSSSQSCPEDPAI